MDDDQDSLTEQENDEQDSLTEQENAVYDRQIRVWGAEAQKRLTRSRILVAGMRGVTAELCKNLVLAGVGKLTLLDDRPLSQQTSGSNFLIPFQTLGDDTCSVASKCAESLKEFNPMVHVCAEEGSILEKPESFLADYDAVILGGSSVGEKKAVNLLCRKQPHRVAFYTIDCRGSCGSLFVDLQKHSYNTQKGSEKSCKEKQFPSLEEVLSVRWDSLPRKTSTLFFAMRIIEEFEQSEGRLPGQISSDDRPRLLALGRRMCELHAVSDHMLPEGLLGRLVAAGTAELPAVCAIVGGVLGQEVVKAMSGKGEPLKNHFFYDASDGKGIIEDLPPSQ